MTFGRIHSGLTKQNNPYDGASRRWCELNWLIRIHSGFIFFCKHDKIRNVMNHSGGIKFKCAHKKYNFK